MHFPSDGAGVGVRSASELPRFSQQILGPGIADPAHMVQCGDRTSFRLESCAVLAFELLDPHDAVESRVAHFPHFSRGAFSDQREASIQTQPRSGSYGHGFKQL